MVQVSEDCSEAPTQVFPPPQPWLPQFRRTILVPSHRQAPWQDGSNNVFVIGPAQEAHCLVHMLGDPTGFTVSRLHKRQNKGEEGPGLVLEALQPQASFGSKLD